MKFSLKHNSILITYGANLSLDRCHLNTTDAFTGLYSNFDITSLAPGATPRVLYQEVFEAVLAAVADDEHGMVDLVATAPIC